MTSPCASQSTFNLQQWAKLEEELSPPRYKSEESLLPPSYREIDSKATDIPSKHPSAITAPVVRRPGWTQRILNWLRPAERAVQSSAAALAAHLQSGDIGLLDKAITQFHRAGLRRQQVHYKLAYHLTVAAYEHCDTHQPAVKADCERMIRMGNETLMLIGTAHKGVRAGCLYILGRAHWWSSMPPLNIRESLRLAWKYLTEAMDNTRLPSRVRYNARIMRSFLIIQDSNLNNTRDFSLEDIEDMEWALGEFDISKMGDKQVAALSKARMDWMVNPRPVTVLAVYSRFLGIAHMHCATREAKVQESEARGVEVLFLHLDAAIGYLEQAVVLNEGQPETQRSINGTLSRLLSTTVTHRNAQSDLEKANALLSAADPFPGMERLARAVADRYTNV